jgi:MFS family permease
LSSRFTARARADPRGAAGRTGRARSACRWWCHGLFPHFSLSSFNGIQEIYWAVNIVMLVVWGLLSDWLKVRKPFMVLGAAGTILSIVLLMEAKPGVSFTSMAIILSLMSTSLACAYGPWFASFTETLEAHNPALIATGTSLYGFATRAVAVPFGLVLPHILGSPIQSLSGWRTWFWICIGCCVLFVPFIWSMTGHWSPAKARAAAAEHDAKVQEELDALKAPAAA